MCFRGPSAPTPMPAPPPIMPRNPDLARASELPSSKKVVKADEVTGVEYGSSSKKGGQAQGNKVGTDSLRIPLNTGVGDNNTAGQGGLNV